MIISSNSPFDRLAFWAYLRLYNEQRLWRNFVAQRFIILWKKPLRVHFCTWLFLQISNNYFPVHPCDRVSNGDCEEICHKLDGKNHDCQCPKGFELNSDGKTCKKRKTNYLWISLFYLSLFFISSFSPSSWTSDLQILFWKYF